MTTSNWVREFRSSPCVWLCLNVLFRTQGVQPTWPDNLVLSWNLDQIRETHQADALIWCFTLYGDASSWSLDWIQRTSVLQACKTAFLIFLITCNVIVNVMCEWNMGVLISCSLIFQLSDANNCKWLIAFSANLCVRYATQRIAWSFFMSCPLFMREWQLSALCVLFQFLPYNSNWTHYMHHHIGEMCICCVHFLIECATLFETVSFSAIDIALCAMNMVEKAVIFRTVMISHKMWQSASVRATAKLRFKAFGRVSRQVWQSGQTLAPSNQTSEHASFLR